MQRLEGYDNHNVSVNRWFGLKIKETLGELRLIVGLGNPGQDYTHTRHNLGFAVIRHLARQNKVRFRKRPDFKGLFSETKIRDKQLYLFLPSTYMNNSGSAVKQIIDKENISFKDILIVCDDLNLNFGQLRLRSKGSDGGHKGLKSLINCCATQNFARLRLGIGFPVEKEKTVNFVLGEFNKKERERLPSFIQEAADCCVMWLVNGISKAMSQFNKRMSDE